MENEYQRPENTEENAPPIEVPVEVLNSETLQSLIESFILREGTDYGRNEVEMETKMQQILKQIKNGKVKIVFDPATASVTLMTDHEWQKKKPRN